jgi:hypothetical protein
MTRLWILTSSQSSRRVRASVSSRSAGAWIFPGWMGYVTPFLGSTRTGSGAAITARPRPTATGTRVGVLPRGPSVAGSGGANDTDDDPGLSTTDAGRGLGMSVMVPPPLTGAYLARSPLTGATVRRWPRRAAAILTDDERAFLSAARTATLATIAPSGRPRLVPICFVVGEDHAERPPADPQPARRQAEAVRGPPRARPLQDLLVLPDATLLVDHWSEDWSELAGSGSTAGASCSSPSRASARSTRLDSPRSGRSTASTMATGSRIGP